MYEVEAIIYAGGEKLMQFLFREALTMMQLKHLWLIRDFLSERV